jgi:hypothetical protein
MQTGHMGIIKTRPKEREIHGDLQTFIAIDNAWGRRGIARIIF